METILWFRLIQMEIASLFLCILWGKYIYLFEWRLDGLSPIMVWNWKRNVKTLFHPISCSAHCKINEKRTNNLWRQKTWQSSHWTLQRNVSLHFMRIGTTNWIIVLDMRVLLYKETFLSFYFSRAIIDNNEINLHRRQYWLH